MDLASLQPSVDMDDLFMQWPVDTLQHQHQHPVAVVDDSGETTFPSLQALREVTNAGIVVPELIAEAHASNSWSSGDTDGSCGGGNFSSPASMEHDAWPPTPNSARSTPTSSNLPVMSWNFNAASTQPGSDGTPDATAAAAGAYKRGVLEMVNGRHQPTRRTSARIAASTGPTSPPYAQDHIIAEQKRREKMNQRFIELSTVILPIQMDKATILSDATRHVKELQEKIKALEAGGSNGRVIETVVLVKKPCHAARDDNGSPSSASSGAPAARTPLPEIEARFAEKSVMVRIHCEEDKGVVVRVLSEVEERLHLSITHINVMAFPVSTV